MEQTAPVNVGTQAFIVQDVGFGLPPSLLLLSKEPSYETRHANPCEKETVSSAKTFLRESIRKPCMTATRYLWF
jgi:hypothetical protein